jgi:hypothetical protein
LWTAIEFEFTPTTNSEYQVRDHYDVELGPVAVTLQYVGALTALVHLIFGTAMFSSLLYIGNGDATPLVMKFVASAVICRIMLQFEIGGMIKCGDKVVKHHIVQPPICDDEAAGDNDGGAVQLLTSDETV